MACQNAQDGGLVDLDEWIEVPDEYSNWEIPRNFSEMKSIGSGAFGSVYSALDTKSGKIVAIKRCAMIFLSHDKALSAYREISILSCLKNDHIVKLYNVLFPPSASRDQDKPNSLLSLYLVMEFCGKNLNEVMKSGNLEDVQIAAIITQMLEGVRFIHSAGIAHRDINTRNVLIDDKGNVTIVDFGLASKVSEVSEGFISTWWNTAPEILLSFQADAKVDIWSVGCVLAELLTGSPLFAASNKCHLLKRMIELLNIECYDWVDKITDERLCETARTYKDTVKSSNLAGIFATSNKDIISCLEMLLSFDSTLRPSAEEALKHSFFQTHVNVTHNSYANTPCPILDSNSTNSMECLRELIRKCVDHFQPNYCTVTTS